ILALVHPQVTLQTIAPGADGHELPHTASPHAGECERMKTRFGLCQIDQVLGNAFLLQRVLYHFAITSATLQCVLQRLPSTTGKIVDIARYWIGQHERKIGMS